MTDSAGRWTMDEASRAAALWQKHYADFYDHTIAPKGTRERALTVIARALGRTFENVFNRHHHFGPTFAAAKHREIVAQSDAEAKMQQRRDAASRHTLTGFVMGDPPPGYSALDRKRSGARHG